MRPSTRLDVMIRRLPLELLLETDVRTFPAGENPEESWFHCWDVEEITHVETRTGMREVVDYSDIHEFRRKAVSLGEEVIAVLVEEGEDNERHITTFLSREAPELEEKIYRLESEIIEKYRNRVFDFHLRVVPKGDDGQPSLPGGTYYLLTWSA